MEDGMSDSAKGAGRHPKPRTVRIANDVYALVVCRVESVDEKGRPEVLTVIPPDRVVELSSDPEKNRFIGVYVRSEIMDK